MPSSVRLCVNQSGATVPAYAAVEPTGGVDADGRLQVVKPTRSNSVAVLFNGPLTVAAGGLFGAAPPTPAAVAGVSVGDGGADPGDLPLAAGAAMGTRAGDWFLRAGQAGFRAVAPPTLGAVQVIPDAGTSLYLRVGTRSGTHYAHQQVAYDDAAGAWAAVAGGVSGTVSPNVNAAVELNLSASVPPATVAEAWPNAAGTGYLFAFGGAATPGFYASLSGSSSPYSFAQCDGPNFGASATAGGQSGTANATELLTGLAGIPSGTVVWMSPTSSPTAFTFQCLKFVIVTSWKANPASPCSIIPATTTTYYESAANLCGRGVDAVLA